MSYFLSNARENFIEHFKVSSALNQLDTGFKQLDTGFKQLDTGFKQLDTGFKQFDTGLKQLDTGFDTGFKQLDTGFKQLDTNFKQFDSGFDSGFKQFDSGFKQIDSGFKQFDTGFKQFDTGIKQIDTGVKQTDDVIQQGTKLKDELASITSKTDNVGSKAAKKMDNVTDNVKDAYKAGKNLKVEDAKAFIKKYGGLIVAGVALVTIISIAIAKFNEVNNKTFQIKKISKDKDSGYIKIEYDPSQTLHEDDTIELKESNSDPNLLGTYRLVDLLNDNTFLIDSKATLVREGTQGLFVYRTTFGNMLQTTMRDVVSNSAEIASKGVLQPILKSGVDVAKDTFKTIFDSLIPPSMRNYAYGISIALIIISVLSVIMIAYNKLK
jgi:uncharacterized phage infection (PIP) family protein YhgE